MNAHGEQIIVREREIERGDPRCRACSYLLCCAHFCQLSDRKVSAVLFRLSIVLFGTFIIRYHNTTLYVIANHFPSAIPSPLLRSGIRMFPLIILFIHFSFYLLDVSSLPFRFTRSYPLISNHAESIFIFYRSTAVECILYTFLRRDILVLLWDEKMYNIY